MTILHQHTHLISPRRVRLKRKVAMKMMAMRVPRSLDHNARIQVVPSYPLEA